MKAQTNSVNDYLTHLEQTQESKIYYHATAKKNLDSILKHGLHPKFGELYFSSSQDSAARWVALGNPGDYVVFGVSFKDCELTDGVDHSLFMEAFFPGEVKVYNKPVYNFESIVFYNVGLSYTHSTTAQRNVKVEGTVNAPWEKTKEQNELLHKELVESARNFLEKQKQKQK